MYIIVVGSCDLDAYIALTLCRLTVCEWMEHIAHTPSG